MMTKARDRALYYVLYSGNLYGTERMALATLKAVQQDLGVCLVAPRGPVHGAARADGIATIEYAGKKDLALKLRQAWRGGPSPAVITTSVTQALVALGVSATLSRRRIVHLHAVHGGTEAHGAYGRKAWLNRLPIRQIAVSPYVGRRLVEHGVRPQRIALLENFLTDDRIASAPLRPAFTAQGAKKIVVVSRVDAVKQLPLLFAALDADPSLVGKIEIAVIGDGPQKPEYEALAREKYRSVRFVGWQDDVPRVLAEADTLVHLNHEEPFGLVVLEAMAARLPVLVPDGGGAGEIVRQAEGAGRLFAAGDARDLARKLARLADEDPSALNALAETGHRLARERYSEAARRKTLLGLLG